MHIATYFGMLQASEKNLSDAFLLVSDRHDRDPEIRNTAKVLATWSNQRLQTLEPLIKRYGDDKSKNEQVQMLQGALFHGTRIGSMGMLADLQDLQMLA